VLYVEGLATHDGPEPCVDVPRGRGEASVGVRAGRAIEPRNQWVRGAHTVHDVESHTGGSVIASCRWAPRGLRSRACTEPPGMRTGIAPRGAGLFGGRWKSFLAVPS
jgi:hypothetical protein